jgi:hypothetical protein
MADFVAVLKKTIDGLGETTPEVREKVYQKARATVGAKLAAINPPPPAAVAARQRQALEDAIRKIEDVYSAKPKDPLAELDALFAELNPKANAPASGPVAQVRPASTPLTGSLIAAERNENKAPAADLTPLVSKPGGSNHPSDQDKSLRLMRRASKKPPDPEIREGPKFQLRGSKLAAAITPPGNLEMDLQAKLHQEIRSVLKAADGELLRVENKYPELAKTVRMYAALLEADIQELNVVGVWSVGGALYGFTESYREQNAANTLSVPLEPGIAATLKNLTRMHGAFVMGFAESRDLVEKSVDFEFSTTRWDEISQAGNNLIDVLIDDATLIDDAARRINKPIAEYVHEFGWHTSRGGYIAYITVRNGIFALLSATFGSEKSIAIVASTLISTSALAGDPSAEFIRSAIPVILRHSSDMLTFFNHSPEFRGYIEWALSLLADDDGEVSRS